MKTSDIVDTIAAQLYDISPDVIYSRSRVESVVYARFTAISLRYESGVSINKLATQYRLERTSILYALRKTRDLTAFNASFRKKYARAQYLYTAGYVPFCADRVKNGVTVRTRADSGGIVRCGVITKINAQSFTVESFDDPTYHTVHDRHTGRISDKFESSLDIVAINT